MPTVHATLERNRTHVLARLNAAARRAGRSPDALRLVAVTKTQPPEVAAALVALGQEDLAENRLEGLESKRACLDSRGLRPRWHWVGRLQRNKARRVVQLADAIHSIDRQQLLDTLARLSAEEGRCPAVYLQVQLAEDGRKAGFQPEELPQACSLAARSADLELVGLMTMAPLVKSDHAGEQRGAARTTFARLAELARGLSPELFASGAPRLSMGMSADMEEAVAEGAHDLRVGRALFSDLETSSRGEQEDLEQRGR